MTRGEILKDFFMKTLFPALIILVLFVTAKLCLQIAMERRIIFMYGSFAGFLLVSGASGYGLFPEILILVLQ